MIKSLWTYDEYEYEYDGVIGDIVNTMWQRLSMKLMLVLSLSLYIYI